MLYLLVFPLLLTPAWFALGIPLVAIFLLSLIGHLFSIARKSPRLSVRFNKFQFNFLGLVFSVVSNHVYHYSATLHHEKYLVFYAFAFLFLLMSLLPDWKCRLTPTSQSSAVVSVMVISLVLVSLILGERNFDQRSAPIGWNINQINLVSVLVALSVAGLWRQSIFYVSFASIGLTLSGLLTLSRGTVLTTFAAFFGGKLRPLMYIAMIIPFSFILADPDFMARLTRLLGESASDPRFTAYARFSECFRESPLFGCGFGTREVIRDDIHNFLLEAWFDGGILVGALMFTQVSLFIRAFFRSYFPRDSHRDCLQCRSPLCNPYWRICFLVLILASSISFSFLLFPYFLLAGLALYGQRDVKEISSAG